jgi:hypothetical protein
MWASRKSKGTQASNRATAPAQPECTLDQHEQLHSGQMGGLNPMNTSSFSDAFACSKE